MLTLACALCRRTLEKICSSWPPLTTVIKNLTCWSCRFAFRLQWINLPVPMNGEWVHLGDKNKKLNPKFRSLVGRYFGLPFFQSSGWWIVVEPYLFTPLVYYTLPVINVLDIRYPQQGRCLGGEIHLIFWALRIVVFFNLQRLRSCIVKFLFGWTTWKERCDTCPCPVCFWGCCLENSGLKMWPEEFNQSKLVWPRKSDLKFSRIVAVRASNYSRCAVLTFFSAFISLCKICSKDVQRRVINWTNLFDLLPPPSAIAGWKMDHECMNLTPPLTLVFFLSWWTVPYQW